MDATVGGKALASPPAGAVVAKLTVFTNPIRYVRDTAAVTAAMGHYATDKDRILLIGREEITGFRAIREGGSDAVVIVSYYEGTYDASDIALLAAGL